MVQHTVASRQAGKCSTSGSFAGSYLSWLQICVRTDAKFLVALVLNTFCFKSGASPTALRLIITEGR